ncbi:LytTR family DNA-binding domain-containing protein [Actinoplanes sp. NPDC051411]|uniref:LytR/AlgR family response regulator transcription factor n=1 Tax=Actinoplanes sp. NPDC051411 TaxID=3155522 RepID=UPI00341C5D5C
MLDDEPHARDEISFLLDGDPRIGSVRSAASGASALKLLSNEPFDVLFCDIKMPGLNGLELARVVSQFSAPPAIVFITAYEDHAVEAFGLQAVDYVMKPIRAERLRKAVRRAVESRLSAHSSPAEHEEQADETIPVELGGVTRFVHRSEVRYVEAYGDYVRLYTDDGEQHLIRATLNVLEERWSGAGFVRTHRSLLVRLDRVDEMIRSPDGHTTLRVGPDELAVSRRHYREVRDRLASR